MWGNKKVQTNSHLQHLLSNVYGMETAKYVDYGCLVYLREKVQFNVLKNKSLVPIISLINSCTNSTVALISIIQQ